MLARLLLTDVVVGGVVWLYCCARYEDRVAHMPFHVDKADQYGNSMLTVACQNGNMKAAKLLVRKGCNPNHQNVRRPRCCLCCVVFVVACCHLTR